jgi:hypothetical protein
MKMKFISWVALAFIGFSTHAAELADSDVRTRLPGTGISILAPKGFVRNSFGTGLSDIRHRSFIVFNAGEEAPGATALEDTYRTMYPRPPEAVVLDGALATLYQKNRREDGGEWDGLTLVLKRNGRTILAGAQYLGTDQDEISRLRASLLSVQWDGSAVDAEAAFGVSLRFDGLRLVSNTLGFLGYTESGKFAKGTTTVMVSPLPLAQGLSESFAEKCKAVLVPAFRRRAVEGPRFSEAGGKHICEIWTADQETTFQYMALVAMTSDSGIFVGGWTEGATVPAHEKALASFRSGIASLRDIQ